MKARLIVNENGNTTEIQFFEGLVYLGCVFRPTNLSNERQENGQFRLSWSGESLEAHTFMRFDEVVIDYTNRGQKTGLKRGDEE